MKVLIVIISINNYRNVVLKETPAVPRIGDKIDVFYDPSPTVKSVIWFPSDGLLKQLNIGYSNITAIVLVE